MLYFSLVDALLQFTLLVEIMIFFSQSKSVDPSKFKLATTYFITSTIRIIEWVKTQGRLRSTHGKLTDPMDPFYWPPGLKNI